MNMTNAMKGRVTWCGVVPCGVMCCGLLCSALVCSSPVCKGHKDRFQLINVPFIPKIRPSSPRELISQRAHQPDSSSQPPDRTSRIKRSHTPTASQSQRSDESSQSRKLTYPPPQTFRQQDNLKQTITPLNSSWIREGCLPDITF